jgi:DNA-directed RNA polymerase specialized sigma24 family protein
VALSPEAFDALLERLDADRERAGERYEELHLRLVKFFQWRHAAAPDELADETIDRVGRRLLDDATLRPQSWPAYVHGFARNVLRESWKARTDAPHDEGRVRAADAAADAAAEGDSKERGLECLDRCLAELPEDSRRLVLEYYAQEGTQVEHRRQVAEEHGLPLNALRLRVHRIRARLDGCVRGCLSRRDLPPTSIPDPATLQRGPVRT